MRSQNLQLDAYVYVPQLEKTSMSLFFFVSCHLIGLYAMPLIIRVKDDRDIEKTPAEH